jgi:pimeloyl-ACP methyl ester carboxylesterase
VHDAGSNGHVWQGQLEAFGGDHSPVAFDFPGHGRSGGTEGFRSIEEYANFLILVLEALQLPRCVLVGHGMGGAVAVAAALSHPQRVRALALVGTGVPPEVAPEVLRTWEEVMRGRAPQPFTTEAFSSQTDFALMRKVWTEQVQTDPRVRYYDLVAHADYDPQPHLARLRLPVLLLVGRDDQVTPVDAVRRLHEAIDGSNLAEIEGAGHWVAVEKQEEFNRALGDFLGELP